MSALRHVLTRCLRSLPASSDAELLAAYAARRDEGAFHALVERHGPMVLRVCTRVLGDRTAAEDAFQATFLLLARRAADLYRPERLAGWLFGTARRVALNARTAAERRQRHERAAAVAPAAAEPTARDLFDALDEEVARLPEGYRLPLLLTYWQGLTQAEVAARLGWSAGAVKGRLERGRRRLAERLRRRGVAPEALLAMPAAKVPTDLVASAVAVATGRVAASAAVLALAASPSKTLPLVALALLMAGAGAWQLAGDPAPADPPPAAPAPPAVRVDADGDPLPDGAVRRFGSTRFRHGTHIRQIAYAPDGKTLATCSDAAAARLWDATTGRELRRFVGHGDAVRFVAFTPDGRQLITASGLRPEDTDLSVRLWDAATGREVRKLVGEKATAIRNAHALSPDGSQLAYVEGDRLKFVAAVTGTPVVEMTLPAACAHEQPECSSGNFMRFSPDGRQIAVILHGFGVCVFDATERKLLFIVPRAEQEISWASSVVFAPNGQWLLASTATEGWQRLCDLRRQPGEVVRPFGPSRAEPAPAISPDGRRILASHATKGLCVWDAQTNKVLAPVPAHHLLTAAAFAPDGATIAVGRGNAVGLYDAATLQPRHDEAGEPLSAIERFEFAAGGAVVRAFADVQSPLPLFEWDAATGRPRPRPDWVKRHDQLAFSPDGTTVAVQPGQSKSAIRLVEAGTGRTTLQTTTDHGHARRLAFTTDGRYLLGDSSNRSIIHVWNATTGQALAPFRIPDHAIPSGFEFAVSPDASRLAVLRETRVELWDFATRTRQRTLEGAAGDIAAVAFSPDSKLIAAVAASRGYWFDTGKPGDRRVFVWDAATGALTQTFDGAAGGGRSVAWSPDGKLLAAGGEDGAVRVWDWAAKRELRRHAGHDGPVTALAFAPDGKRLYSGGTDTTVLVWDTAR